MNSPSPLVPQGSSLEQQQQTRSSLKVKIFCALGVNVTVLLLLLMQGCKREQPQPTEEMAPVFSETAPPPMALNDTNGTYATGPETNAVIPPPSLPVVETPPLPPELPSEYVILKGDTFSTIAPKFRVTVKELQTANPTVDPAKLQIGKKIIIPPPSAAVSPSGVAGVAAPVTDNPSTYKVKSGDTLTKIAADHHTTVKALQAANNLTDSRIKVGQVLKLPPRRSIRRTPRNLDAAFALLK